MNKAVYLALIGAAVAQKTPFAKHRMANLHKRKLQEDWETFDMEGMDWESFDMEGMDSMDWDMEAPMEWETTAMEWDESMPMEWEEEKWDESMDWDMDMDESMDWDKEMWDEPMDWEEEKWDETMEWEEEPMIEPPMTIDFYLFQESEDVTLYW